MGKNRHTAEEIVAKLRQVGALMAQGLPVADAVRGTCFDDWMPTEPEENGSEWRRRRGLPSPLCSQPRTFTRWVGSSEKCTKSEMRQ